MKDLFQVGNRTNINKFSLVGKDVFIYEDHRSILNILYHANVKDVIEAPVDIIYFDYHDDAIEPSEAVKSAASKFKLSESNEREFNSIVEHDLRPLDDDWVKSGMEFGLINDAVVIGAEEYQNIGSDSWATYSDVKNNTHNLYSISHLSASLGSRGCLGDSQLTSAYFKPVRELFNYDYRDPEYYEGPSKHFVLDFDLDCFSAPFRSKQMAWPENQVQEEFFEKVGFYGNYTPFEFIKVLIDKCEFITICTEPNSCGGYKESFKILQYLDKYLFNDELRTN